MTHLGSHTAPTGNSLMSRSQPMAGMNYMEDIKQFPILSEAQEQDLIERWYGRGDRKAYDALIASHLRLVPKIAQRYAGYGIPVVDLIGEGNIGLLQSAERFEPEKGFRFSTYARWWIRAAMLNFILQTWSMIKLGNGAGKKRLFFNLRRAKQALRADGDRHLDDADIAKLAKHFQVSTEDIVAMDQRMSAKDVSLYQTVPGSTGFTFGDMIADDTATPEERAIEGDERKWHRDQLRQAMANLDKREKDILKHRYLTDEPATLAKLARVHGLTAERVRQIEAKAIDKLRHYLSTTMAPTRSAYAH